ncbi:DNA polymerase III subunit alpha [Flavobacterium aquatile]|uniref:DNA polymerase III subunit alpha n=1 Tax=Flavobacterium aquatile LMG 4008 = ATCC 11947 TaxID=1453498 RepID=A0A095SRN2_9FLAO|nr:DNA polymerase III subunit alpha [Flavobacterium aquatile]KGD67306.1 DNA polymerase III subunit alpha [Flavobacterium aquatile LMG 4008 = ATCC 11947]OXA66543.1 DNA polymerase III subunit alpha [Flavobacterium aquatile LMG 4008 = ATCC 11947]GEC78520.1 DNA-directed DNA polymerase [Flavobacterium aquatile]
MYLIFDTETTGLPKKWAAPISDTDNWPRCIQIAWQLHDEMGNLIEHQDYLVQPEGFNIPYDAERIHGISTELAQQDGISLQEVLEKFNIALSKTKFIVGQNVGFDVNIMGCEFYRLGVDSPMTQMPVLDTCTEVTASLLKLPGGRGGKFKLPTLTELHQYLFNQPFAEAHNATADVEATTRCFLELIRTEIFTKEELDVEPEYFEDFQLKNPRSIQLIGLKHINLKEASDRIRQQFGDKGNVPISKETLSENKQILIDAEFVHLHNHTQFSVLQSTVSVKDLVAAAVKNKMPAVAMTDIGNMMGVFHFVRDILYHNKSAEAKNAAAIEAGEIPTETIIKPIVGCEFFVCDNHKDKSRKDNGYQIVLLAKNKKGYHNLAKMSSIAYTDGFYYVPRIDREIIKQYKEDIIVLSGSLYGEIPNKVLNLGENQAEEALLWWKEQFGDDLYIELMRHNQEDENRVNSSLIDLARKHNVKTVATNNSFYIDKQDANAHDILLCVRDGEKQSTPIGRGRGYRFGLPNQEYYFKSSEEMKKLFADLPEAISNITEIVAKIEIFNLAREVLLPKFDIPEEFLVEEDKSDAGKRGENKFLHHLTYEGAKRRYAEITLEIQERIDFELLTIENSGYPGYFLIVQDFIAEARKMEVSVGPGRGSAAGSVVAYCLGITNIDPLMYNLLFERFLNPDRVSLPDIDIDFDDEGRSKVMDYVINKYGSKQVAQIITYGTMAAKSSVRDTARVLDLPLFEADKIAKLIPLNLNLAKIFSMEEDKLKKALRPEDFDKVKELIALGKASDLGGETIQQAQILEGNLRNTGIHACGVIITPDDITNFVPVATAKDSDLYVTQFDNSVVESAGLLKMDFLGLKTLTLIKDTVKLVKYRTGKDIDPDAFPIDDLKTYELFQRGETVGIFQYESPGMQKYMKELKPTVFPDLIAMNALYRPGPIAYIPSFIKRKNGEEEIVYDLDACEELLKDTYGITVYQEQVMLLSQKLADFSKGDADVLRKAMGKKQRDVLDKMKPKFISQAEAKGHSAEKLEKIWKDWEAFAEYAFNKSHSTCYAWIAYQTAYLKANYPAEYMAAVLSNNMNDIKQVSFFMEECKRMGLTVLGPDVNESFYKFTVNDNYAVRFGMGAVKGVGANAVDTIVQNRKDAPYKSIFDLAKKIDLRAANKKAFESLAFAGGFDCFTDTHRAQYFHIEGEGITFLEKAIRYGSKFQENENSSQVSLFGESSDVQIAEPVVPPCEDWSTMEKLAKEKEVVGIYISGHPLDDYRFEMKYFCNVKLAHLKSLESLVGKTLTFGGIVTNVQYRTGKNGKDWAMFTLEGYDESHDFRIFNEEYLKFRHFLVNNQFIYFKIHVKDGWVNRDTGKKSDPQINFQDAKLLADVLPTFAKKIAIQLDIYDLHQNLIQQLNDIFRANEGDHQVSFDVLEIERTKKIQAITPEIPSILPEIPVDNDVEVDIDNLDVETEIEEEVVSNTPVEMEENRVVTKLSMPSRKLKIKISKELLEQLEKLQVNFKLN